MLRNLVKETANNPGTGSSVTLGGALAGFRTFASEFTTGSPVFYFITDGAQTEAQAGTLTSGPPAILSRGTPLWTSTGVLSRLNFTGAVTVFCQVPANRLFYGDSAGNWDGQARRLRNIAKAAGPDEAMRRDQVGWEHINTSINAGAVGGVYFVIPAGYSRVRFEFQDFAPTLNAWAFARFNADGTGNPDLSASIAYNIQFLTGIPQFESERSGADNFLRMTGDIPQNTTCMGELELSLVAGMTRALYRTTYLNVGPTSGAAWGGGHYNNRAVSVFFYYSNGASVAFHRIKMLGSKD
jgi:hypothetical protein